MVGWERPSGPRSMQQGSADRWEAGRGWAGRASGALGRGRASCLQAAGEWGQAGLVPSPTQGAEAGRALRNVTADFRGRETVYDGHESVTEPQQSLKPETFSPKMCT